jgi:serine/threonine protein kinase
MIAHPKYALPIGHVVGGYGIIRVIGRGGFGIVYEAVNPVTQQRVAIKEFSPNAIATREGTTVVLHDERDRALYDRVLERFRATAARQFGFNHPNILRVFNYIPAENTGYMITDYIDGEPLSQFLQPYNGHFPSEAMFRDKVEQLLDALRYLHQQGHLHRDISPENAMIDKSGKATLIDFGALKLDLKAGGAYSTVVVYRADYSPLEQQSPSAKRQEGFSTDIFALAGTMYYTLAGVPPIQSALRALGDTYVSIAQASKIRCHPRVFAAIDGALKLPSQERPQSVDEFVAMLGWGAQQPQPSPPPSPLPPRKTMLEVLRGYGLVTVVAAFVIAIFWMTSNASPPPPPQFKPASPPEPGLPPKQAGDEPKPPRTVLKPIPPSDLVLPNGTYQAQRRYDKADGSECRAYYLVENVQVLDGRISFDSGGFTWSGAVDQRTGYINIPNEGVIHTATRQLSKNRLTLKGNYRNAEVQSGRCGRGSFAIK